MKNTIPHPRRLTGLLPALAAVTLTATGCHVTGAYDPTPADDATKAAAVLASLPSFEDTQGQVQAAIDEVKSAAAQLIPSITWITPHEGSALGCQKPYEQTDGKGYILPDTVAVRVPISEEHWAEIERAAAQAAAKLEATDVQTMQDQPGNHDVGFYGPAGLFLKVGYHGNLVVSGYTGCRLPRAQK